MLATFSAIGETAVDGRASRRRPCRRTASPSRTSPNAETIPFSFSASSIAGEGRRPDHAARRARLRSDRRALPVVAHLLGDQPHGLAGPRRRRPAAASRRACSSGAATSSSWPTRRRTCIPCTSTASAPRSSTARAEARPVHRADTVLLNTKERIRLAFVADNPGDWMFHCHILEHQETGMMGIIRVA